MIKLFNYIDIDSHFHILDLTDKKNVLHVLQHEWYGDVWANESEDACSALNVYSFKDMLSLPYDQWEHFVSQFTQPGRCEIVSFEFAFPF